MKLPLIACSLLCTIVLPSCATNDNPPCRRVTAEQFMVRHSFKGIASDQFIGVTGTPFKEAHEKKDEKAFKQIWEMGWNHHWAIIWCPVSELPADYLKNAHKEPNRDIPARADGSKS